jgi:hypothetical protein
MSKGIAPSKNALVEQALLKELKELPEVYHERPQFTIKKGISDDFMGTTSFKSSSFCQSGV